MRILIVTASLPYPLASGGAIRTFGILDGLYQAGHEVTLLSFADQQVDLALSTRCNAVITVQAPAPRSKAQRLQTLILTQQADIASRFHSTEFENTLLNLIKTEAYDLIQFEGIEAATYLPTVRRHYPAAKLCFDTFNAEARLQAIMAQIKFSDVRQFPSAVYSLIQSRRLHNYEAELCRLADLVIAVSEEDAAILDTYLSPHKPSIVVPSGIFSKDYGEDQPVQPADLGEAALVFTGKMDYRPNVDAMLWFTDRIWPRIERGELWIVGQRPEPEIQKLSNDERIHVTGWVDSVQPYLKGAQLYIAPLRMGSGTRLKLLEAMAAGCAIVATDIAASGLLPEAKSTLIIADEPDAFANAIQQLLNNPILREELGSRARKAVHTYYDWHALLPRLFDAYKRLDHGSR